MVKKILIVQDGEMNRDLLVQLLEDDYELAEASDGKEGLAKATSERPDLILLDMYLRDGYDVTRHVRADDGIKDTPIIAVTTYAMAEEKAIEVGCNDYIRRPIDEDELWAKVEKHLLEGGLLTRDAHHLDRR